MKQRFLDTLKMIGVCVAVIAFFSFLAASCEDTEDRAEREAAMEELRDQVWDEAYRCGYDDGYDAAAYDLSYAEGSRSSDDFPVYISSSFTMHKKSTCSGMKNYIEMPYSIASQYFTKTCGTCFKKVS